MSDIEYLSIKEFEGKKVETEDETSVSVTTETVLSSLTASTGKDLYFVKAGVDFQKGSATIDIPTFRLEANGVELELIRRRVPQDSNGGFVFTFPPGQKVATAQEIEVTVTQTGANAITYKSYLVGFEEDTGASPAV